MCNCEHHRDRSKWCTCSCPDHRPTRIAQLRADAERLNRRRRRTRAIVAIAGMAVGAAMGSFVTTWIMENLL